MEQIFVLTTRYQLHSPDSSDILEVNNFLKENPYYTMKNTVPVTQHDGSGCYGAIITVGEK